MRISIQTLHFLFQRQQLTFGHYVYDKQSLLLQIFFSLIESMITLYVHDFATSLNHSYLTK